MSDVSYSPKLRTVSLKKLDSSCPNITLVYLLLCSSIPCFNALTKRGGGTGHQVTFDCIFSSCNRENYKTWKPVMPPGVSSHILLASRWGVPATDRASLVCQWPQQAVTWQLQEGQTSSAAPLRTAAQGLFQVHGNSSSEGLRAQSPQQRAPVARLLWVWHCSAGLRISALPSESCQEWVHCLPLFPISIDCFEQENF